MKVISLFDFYRVAESKVSSIPVEGAKEKLKQVKAELAHFPSNPQTQKEYDAIDEVRAEISKLEKFIKDNSKLTEDVNSQGEDLSTEYMERYIRVQRLMKDLAAKIQKHKDEFAGNTTNWGYVGELDEIITKLKEVA